MYECDDMQGAGNSEIIHAIDPLAILIREAITAALFHRLACPRSVVHRLVAISIIPFKDANGAITGIAAMMRDVTKRFEELKALRKQLASVKGY
jgi:hypothetical protein